MANLIKDQVKAEAAERKKEGGEKGRRSRHGDLACVSKDTSQQDEQSPSARKSRQQIAKAVGMGRDQLAQATKVLEHDPHQPPSTF